MNRAAYPRDPSRRRWLRRCWRQGSGTVLLLTAADLAHGAQVLSVRVWPAQDYTRITLESDVALRASQHRLQNPSRLVIDIDDLALSPQLRELVAKVRPDDPYIQGLRVTTHGTQGARIVVDLKQDVDPQLFSLPPVAAYQHRLVFDLYPLQAPDPMVALIQGHAGRGAPSPRAGRESAAQSGDHAASAVNDALDEWLTHQQVGQKSPASAPPLASERPGPSDLPLLDPHRLIIVALDPGHGGEDPGAIGPAGTYEKHVALSIARKLKERLETAPNVRVLMTRDSDFFVPLQERVNKARRVHADLFVSIHADAFTNPQAHGASVFALSEHGATSATARWMANSENAADVIGGINFKTHSQLVLRTLLDLSTTAQIKDSLVLGSEVLRHIGGVSRLHNASVERAGFAVLKAPDIPSILVETGFISNPEEETRLRTDDYQNLLADALQLGLMRYFARQPALRQKMT